MPSFQEKYVTILSIIGEDSGFDQLSDSTTCSRKEYSDEDGWVIARIFQSEEGHRGAVLVHDSLMRQGATGNLACPETTFPFVGKTTLKVRSKRIRSGAMWRDLVFSIRQCSGPFPFEKLMIDRDNDNNRSPHETDIPDEEKQAAWTDRKKDLDVDERQKFQSEQEPERDIAGFKIVLPSERFAAITGKEILKPDKEKCQYESEKCKALKKLEFTELGTGLGICAATEVARVTLDAERIRRQTALLASFEHFRNPIDIIGETRGFEASIRTLNEETEFIPLLKARENVNGHIWIQLRGFDAESSWAIYQDREVNIIFLSLSEEKENLIVCLVSLDDGCELFNSTIKLVLRRLTEEEGRWENIERLPYNMRILTLKHTWSSVRK